MKNVSKELIGASAIPLILTILTEGENYGYEILQRIKEISGGELEWSEGSLYPVLHKLEKNDQIVSAWRKSENGRKRKYYSLNKKGKELLNDQKENWQFINSIMQKLWLKQVDLT